MSDIVGGGILEEIESMNEKEAKNLLAKLLLNYEKVGRNNYTKEDCFKDYDKIFREVVTKNMFGI